MSLNLSLTHRFGDFTLDVSLEAPSGITAFFGRSGAGKSSVIKAMAGLLTPDQGRIDLDGETLLDTKRGLNIPPHRRRFATVFQDARLFPHLNVAQNLDFAARYTRDQNRIKRRDVTHLLGLDHLESRAPRSLSGGESQRVALGRALLSQPRLLLMDEPLASLDGPRKDEILPFLEHLRDGPLGLNVLYVSHDVNEVARLADTLVLLKEGHVVGHGPLIDMLSDPAALPLLGVRDAGAVLHARVLAHADDGLTRLQLSQGQLDLAGIGAAVGSTVRLRILARDVILARRKPQDISARNILPVTIEAIHQGSGPGAAIALRSGTDKLLARITRRAVHELQLETGQTCFAILKATSVAPGNISA